MAAGKGGKSPKRRAVETRLRGQLRAARAEAAAARRREAASAAILRQIVRSPSDTRPVFDAIVRACQRLFGGQFVGLMLLEGGTIVPKAAVDECGKPISLEVVPPWPYDRGSGAGRCMLEKRPVNLGDLARVGREFPRVKNLALRLGYRSGIWVPLMRKRTAIGALSVARRATGTFTAQEVARARTFADQAVIAIENVRLFDETREALERQTATAEVLRVISGSPTDIQPVLDAVAERAARLCAAPYANVLLREGNQLRVMSVFSTEAGPLPDRRNFVPLGRRYLNGRAVVDRSIVHVPDVVPLLDSEYPEARQNQRKFGFRATLVVPLMREGEAVGTIWVWRREPGLFADTQVELLKTFADQAVIAIENVRLFNETREALERQTATAEILQVISSSPTDVQPVYDAIVASALRLIGGFSAVATRIAGDSLQLVAFTSVGGEGDEALRRTYPRPVNEGFTGMAVATGAPVMVADTEIDSVVSPTQRETARVRGYRSLITVPMLREGIAVGSIAVSRRGPGSFAQHQVELLKAFAAQAVIAIENVRLFNETREALERQTATAEILKVIASSPSDVQPVFDTIANSANRLMGGHATSVERVIDGIAHLVAITSTPAGEEGVRRFFPRPLAELKVIPEAVRTGLPVVCTDIEVDPRFSPEFREVARARGFRSQLTVPMMREREGIGTINVTRRECGPFSQHEVALLMTFADQAVIAIENVRLFNETKEALERQTATAEILRVISSSPTDIQPVFDAVVAHAHRLCDASFSLVTRFDGELIHLAATCNLQPGPAAAMRDAFPARPSGRGVDSRAILNRAIVHIPDVRDDPEYTPGGLAEATGVRSVVAVPMLRGDRSLGSIGVARSEPRPFTEQQIAILKTFADQAVIAIENVRLFNETKEALERQTATAEILEVISSSPTNVQPVLDAVAERAGRICDGRFVDIFMVDRGELRLRAWYGELARLELNEALPLSRETVTGRAIIDREPVHVLDLMNAPVEEFPRGRELAARFGHRTTLAVPLMRENEALGGILMRRTEVRPFSEKQIALLKTFASQAAIAIENVRLFNETKEALERQTATGEILKVIAGSPSQVKPVLDAIVESAVRLFEPWNASITMREADLLQLRAAASPRTSRLDMAALASVFPARIDPANSLGARAVLEARLIEVPDMADPDVPATTGKLARTAGFRSAVYVPLVREGEGIGLIALTHPEPGHRFNEKQLSLVKTFADQAVIAIENVRLFNETREALERQTATAEILKVIASSPSDVQPVFDAIAESAKRLLGARSAVVRRLVGGSLEVAAYTSTDPVGDQFVQQQTPQKLSESATGAMAVRTGAPAIVSDTEDSSADVPEADRQRGRERGYRSMLVVPMLREGAAIGTLGVARSQPGQFSDHQIELLKTFADQAVIAIENVRLFNETREALERQTTTAEILKVISESPTDVQPVFEAIVQSALQLFPAWIAAVLVVDNDELQLGAVAGADVTASEIEAIRALFPIPLDSQEAPSAVALRERRILEVLDTEQEPRFKAATRFARAGRWRAGVFVPMMREGHGIGTVVLAHREPGNRLSGTQLALVQTFADQAVIAIENVRLFKELQSRTEALTKSVGQLRALSEVGQAISSTLDLDKVLQTIVSRAVQLTGLDGGAIYEYDETQEIFLLRGGEKLREEILELNRSQPIRMGDGFIGRAAATRAPVQVPDLEKVPQRMRARDVLLQVGARALLAVPLVRENHVLGALAVIRNAAGEFPPEVIALLETFATQSAIAIQNARLFREIEDKGRQLEEASQHKSQFLASMSHELRTPLNAILGFNEMLLDQVYGELSPEVQAPLENMQASGKHLLRLINNVLDLAKIEAGRMELALGDYAVQDAVESVRRTLQPLAAEKGLEFVARVPADIPLAYGDGGRISQCLMNLAGNSLKFTKAGKVEIAVEQRDGQLRYSVADTGIGIPPEKIDGLFTEFKQTDATVASEYGGTGLGLSITKKFIELHGGRIWVESEPGKGSTFLFEVPLRLAR